MILPAISIRQPWAEAIISCGKDVENRAIALPKKYHGEFVLIHAGLKMERKALSSLLARGYGHRLAPCLDLGGIVGALRFFTTQSRKLSEKSIWAEPFQSHWHIAGSLRLPFFPCKGHLGFFKVDYPLDEMVLAEVGRAYQNLMDAAPGITINFIS